MVVVTLKQILVKNKDEELEPMTLYLDGFLKSDLDFVRERVVRHNDFFLLIVDGRVGSGKSTLGIQSAVFLNQKTDLTNICWSLEQFENKLKCAQEGDCVVLDEAFELNKRSSQSSANFRILTLLQQCREKKIFVILILPSMYDLDKNVILSLADLFLHVWREPFGRRGQFSCYDRSGFVKLWLNARQTYTYPKKVARPIYMGKFVKKFPLDYQLYRTKKLKALEEYRNTIEKKGTDTASRKMERNLIIYNMHNRGMKTQEIADFTNLNVRTVQLIIKKINEQPRGDLKQ